MRFSNLGYLESGLLSSKPWSGLPYHQWGNYRLISGVDRDGCSRESIGHYSCANRLCNPESSFPLRNSQETRDLESSALKSLSMGLRVKLRMPSLLVTDEESRKEIIPNTANPLRDATLISPCMTGQRDHWIVSKVAAPRGLKKVCLIVLRQQFLCYKMKE